MSLNALIQQTTKPWLNARVNNVTIDGQLRLPAGPGSTGGNYTQSGSPTTTITANARFGTLQTVGSADGFSLPSFNAYRIQIDNSTYDPSIDNLILGCPNCLGQVSFGDGFPVVKVADSGLGTFTIEIMNAHGTNLLAPISGVIISFLIVRYEN